MSELDAGTADEPLDAVARRIEGHSRKSDDETITAAMLVREARRRVEAGEAGPATWFEWAPANIRLSRSRLYELQRIADADDPRAELERIRRMMRERAKRHRETKAEAEQKDEIERRMLKEWADAAPLDEVKGVWRSIETRSSAHLLQATKGHQSEGLLRAA